MDIWIVRRKTCWGTLKFAKKILDYYSGLNNSQRKLWKGFWLNCRRNYWIKSWINVWQTMEEVQRYFSGNFRKSPKGILGGFPEVHRFKGFSSRWNFWKNFQRNSGFSLERYWKKCHWNSQMIFIQNSVKSCLSNYMEPLPKKLLEEFPSIPRPNFRKNLRNN